MRISDWSSDVCSSDLCPSMRRRIELRHAHGDAIVAIGQALDRMRTAWAVDGEPVASGGTVAHQPGRDAARAVAALTGLAAVAVPHAVRRDRAFAARRFDGPELVPTHALVAIAPPPPGVGGRWGRA